MEAPSGHDLHALLAETRWGRQLAGTLVNDPHDADDLAQEVSAVALGRPPARATNLRAWLRVVMQSLVLQRVRSSRRRSRREEIAGQLARTAHERMQLRDTGPRTVALPGLRARPPIWQPSPLS